MKINEFLNKHKSITEYPNTNYTTRELVPTIECSDGFSMSVQVGHCHYCTPRTNNEIFYSCVEVGFPSAMEPDLMPFADDERYPTKTVYGYVPVEIVNAIIDKHGGIKQQSEN
jgi:hypothetical protein